MSWDVLRSLGKLHWQSRFLTIVFLQMGQHYSMSPTFTFTSSQSNWFWPNKAFKRTGYARRLT